MVEGDEEKQASQSKGREGLKVTDRRHFTADGERRSEVPDVPDETEAPHPIESAGPSRADGGADAAGFERRPLEEPEGVDFTMLVNAMAQPALLFLGEIAHPATGQPTVDLEQARIQIDMLGLLRVKCRGNLTAQEEALLDRVLYQLRMLYVSRTSKPS